MDLRNNRCIRANVILTTTPWGHTSQVHTHILFNASDIKGPLCVVYDSVSKKTLTISPAQSQYNVIISDGFAQLTLKQMYINPGLKLKNTVFVFPLPDNGSVTAMEMEYKGKLYKANIVEKKKAQQIYDSVSALGLIAALLVQDRPNVFQQSLANIATGDSAYVQIKVTIPLKYNSGEYELSLPTMIGERFQSSGSTYVPSSGALWNPPEDRDGSTIQVNVLLQTGFPIRDLSSPTHKINVSDFTDCKEELVKRFVVADTLKPALGNSKGILLAQSTTFPNRDYVLRFRRDAANQDFTVVSHYNYDYNKGHFAFTMFPDDTMGAGARADLEVVLLIDISGSQLGWPLAKEKEIALNIMGRLKSTDKLNVLAFSDNVYWAFGNTSTVYATSGNIKIAKDFIDNLSVMGGTQLLDGVKAALSVPLQSETQRYYVFLTDGFITNETVIIDEIKNHASKPTVFTFGAGNSLNRYFLETSALVGNGFATEVTENENAATMVNPAWEKISSPQIKNLSVTFSNSTIADLIVPKSNVLYAGDPFRIYGTYTTGGVMVVTVKGYKNGVPVEMSKTITLAEGLTPDFMVPQVWAREKIASLMLSQGLTESKKDSIIIISEKYQVLSNYTAFLAVNPQDITSGSALSDAMNNSFKVAVKDVLQTKEDMRFLCNGKIIEFLLPTGVYVTDLIIYDLSGRVIYKCNFNSMNRMSKFLWNGNLSNGKRLLMGKYIVQIKTSSGKTIMRTIIWNSR